MEKRVHRRTGFQKHFQSVNQTHFPIVRIFERAFIENPERVTYMEYSIKYKNHTIFPNRCIAWLGTAWGGSAILHWTIDVFFRKVNIFFPTVEKFLSSILEAWEDLIHLQDIGVWLDIREAISDSRIKVYFLCNIRNSSFFNKAILPYAKNDMIQKIIKGNEVIAGFDFLSDGTIRQKLYIGYSDYEIQNSCIQKRLSEVFSRRIMELCALCQEVYFCIKGEGELEIAFAPYDLRSFCYYFNNTELHALVENMKDSGPRDIVSFSEREIDSGEITMFNLYDSSDMRR